MIYTIKSTLVGALHMPEEEVLRTVRIGGSATLDDLCMVMLDSLAFDRDHMYQFCMDNRPYSRSAYVSGRDRRGKPSTNTKLYKLGLKSGQKFLFIYDFGDDWTFQMEVLSAENVSGNIRPEVLESVGTAEQYPDWEEEFDAEEDKEAPEGQEDAASAGMDQWLGMTKGFPGGLDEEDLSEEYFDDDSGKTGPDGEEVNPRLGRIMLRIIEHQISAGDPAFVGKAYVSLQKKGYIKKLAKVKLAQALIRELFEIMKYGSSYSEARYASFVEEAVLEDVDESSLADLVTGREHTIAELLYDFEESVQTPGKEKRAADLFMEIWPMLKAFINDNYTRETEQGTEKYSLEEIDRRLGSGMELFNSVMDADMAFINSRRYEEGIEVLKEILDTFRWNPGEGASVRGSVGECLERLERKEEADKWFEDWFSSSPKDPDCANYYVLILMERGDMEKAERILLECVPEGLPADYKYVDLYYRAEEFYREKGDSEKEKKFASLGRQSEFGGSSDLDDAFLDRLFKQTPVVNAEKKIYPNDPCPCGSGKKYKKCCGKK